MPRPYARRSVQGVPGTRQNVSQHGPEDHHVGDFELPQLQATTPQDDGMG